MHQLEEKSQIPVVDQVTFPVGDEPVTLAVHVVEALTVKDEGVQLAEVDDAGLAGAVRETVSEDPL
ncbi:MAG: hypothetical protein JRN04_03755 [Nitrososphaerota archaeon]|nr:hypothetical protein [Nitrososphaerota archaeon]